MNSRSKIRPSCMIMGLVWLAGLSLVTQAQEPAITLFDLGAGVRALGMGEAFVGLADDEQAIFYNPAGLAYLQRVRLSAFYESRFAASDYLNASFGMNRVGAGLSLFSFGDVERRDTNDQVQGSFGYLHFAFMAAAGLSLADAPLVGTTMQGLEAFALGLRAKLLLVSTLDPGSGVGFGLDPSFLVNFENVNLGGLRAEAIRAGLSFENFLSTGTSYEEGRHEPWPLRMRLGTALLMSDLAIGLDFAVPLEFHVGGEMRFRPLREMGDLAVRLGAMVRGGFFALTLGLGIEVQDFRFDYALMSHPQLPWSHRLALSWRL